MDDEKMKEIEVVKKHPLFKAAHERTISQAKTIRTLLSYIEELEENNEGLKDALSLRKGALVQATNGIRKLNERIKELEEGVRKASHLLESPRIEWATKNAVVILDNLLKEKKSRSVPNAIEN